MERFWREPGPARSKPPQMVQCMLKDPILILFLDLNCMFSVASAVTGLWVKGGMGEIFINHPKREKKKKRKKNSTWVVS